MPKINEFYLFLQTTKRADSAIAAYPAVVAIGYYGGVGWLRRPGAIHQLLSANFLGGLDHL